MSTEKNHFLKIAKELGVPVANVEATVGLLDEGATVPFISRYRKEMTGSMDEVQVASTRDRIEQLRELDKRREAVLKSIGEQGKLTDELKEKVEAAETLSELEDIYLPYKPKRKTRASIAREKGLEPLGLLLMEQGSFDPAKEAQAYISEEKGVKDVEEALQGARDIVAELINEDQESRARVRELFLKQGTFKARVIPGKEEEGQKYKDYFEWEEPISKAPSHRVLAMRRAEKEMILMLDTLPPEEEAIDILERKYVKSSGAAGDQMKTAVKDSYKRLLRPSMETEIRMGSKQKADEEAIKVFAENLRQLLLAAPLGQKRVMAVDPGFRSGCKVVCLDSQGKLLHYEAIFPHEPQRQIAQSSAIVMALAQKYEIEAIAIGNGTASRETETFIRSLELPSSILVVMVNESGASVYSASELAREEFPDKDVTVRGAVSIGRRLVDPLAELVKIDPKSIGVGQYQHDVDQNLLKKGLDDTVISCVNAVGVEVNTASKQILTYISGLTPTLAQNIVNYRNENGAFKSRQDLMKVPRMGDKAFEQAAGFLRIRDGVNPLDTSAVHPESYAVVEQMAKDLSCEVKDLLRDGELRRKIDLKKYVTDKIGLPTLQDIVKELDKPGRDPREQFEAFSFAEGIHEMKDLREGMRLPGIVTNITKFGCFVDIGVHQDGLIHVSNMADRFISDPTEVVKVAQKVWVTVIEVDIPRKRIALSMKEGATAPTTTGGAKNTSPKSSHSGAPKGGARKEKEPEGDMQAKLSALMGKFK